MGFMEKMGLLKRTSKTPRGALPKGFFEMFTGYTPVWTNAPEALYEMELIRAAIHSFASFCSKLKPEVRGSALQHLEKHWQMAINPYMDTSKFLYRLATILSVNNNAFIIPIEGANGNITGFFPLLPENCEVLEIDGVVYLRYTFTNGQRAAIEFDRVGILTNHHYRDDFFGESNHALKPTMQLIDTNNQGIINAVKSSAQIRFIAKIANMIDPEDITKERDRFAAENLSEENKSGMLIYDNKFSDVSQIKSTPTTIDAAQMKQIAENVYQYFGTNEDILQNKFNEDGFNAYFEGKIEPFAIQLSLVLSNMTYTPREIAHGNEIIMTANRLQYASNRTKLQLSTQLFDRALLNRNGVMDIWNLPHVKDGDRFFIRKEYARLEDLGKEFAINADTTEDEGIQDNDPSVGDSGTGGAHEAI